MVFAVNASAFWPFVSNSSYDKFASISDNFVISTNQVVINSKLSKELSNYTTYKSGILPTDTGAWLAGQCVGWITYITGVNFVGNASSWSKYINSNKPSVGSLIVLKSSRLGHVGIVQKVDKDSITVRSRNWIALWVVSSNIFRINDPIIAGYINF